MNQAENVQKDLIGKVRDEFKRRIASVGNRAVFIFDNKGKLS